MVERSRIPDVIALILALGGVGAIALAGLAMGSHMVPLLTRDMASIHQAHPFDGLLSSAGAFLWLASATALAMTWAVLRPVLPRNQAAFLAAAAGLSGLLWFDDFYMMHDFVLWWYLGVPEAVTLALGAMIALTHIAIFRSEYGGHKPLLVAAALVLLGASVGIDLLESAMKSRIGDWHYLVEESLKWVGIVSWTWWHVSYCMRLLGSKLGSQEKRAGP